MEEIGNGAAACPLAGERVPHAGECAAVEGMHGGALGPNPHGGEAPTSPGSPLSARCTPKAAPAAVVTVR
jgi:hypothetical protein